MEIKYSPALKLIYWLAEGERKGSESPAILPEHFWLGMDKLCDCDDILIRMFMPQLNKEESDQLVQEVHHLRKWYYGLEMEITTSMGILRDMIRMKIEDLPWAKEFPELQPEKGIVLKSMDEEYLEIFSSAKKMVTTFSNN